jgi:hypothetical protein
MWWYYDQWYIDHQFKMLGRRCIMLGGRGCCLDNFNLGKEISPREWGYTLEEYPLAAAI